MSEIRDDVPDTLDIMAAASITKGIKLAKTVRPELYDMFKYGIHKAAVGLHMIDNILADDEFSPNELDEVLVGLRGSGVGRMVYGMVSGLFYQIMGKVK